MFILITQLVGSTKYKSNKYWFTYLNSVFDYPSLVRAFCLLMEQVGGHMIVPENIYK